MDRKWKSGAAVSPPPLDNASDGYASAGNPGTGTPATKPGSHWYHMITEEILALIAAAGIAFDKTVLTQLRDACALLFDTQGVDPGGRLTLTTAVPITTAAVSGATTVYYTPHIHDRIKLYDGTRWKWYSFTEMSQTLADTTKSPAATAATKNYDMFVWDDAGTLRCTRGPLWDTGGGSNTARGTGAGSTELEFFQGRWVNKIAITNGPAARRGLYVGSIATDGSNQVNDNLTKRQLYNLYHQVLRPMLVVESTDFWTYTTASYRQANANTANQFEVMTGLVRQPVAVEVHTIASNNTGGTVNGAAGIGVDSTTVDSAQIKQSATLATASKTESISAFYRAYPSVGRHTYAWLERSDATGTTAWIGDSGVTYIQTGMIGETWA